MKNLRGPKAHSFLAVLLLAGCRDGDGSDEGDGLGSANFCEAYRKVAKEVGCSAELDCSGFKADCDGLSRAWLTCVKKDLTQCICERSGKVNCEGSFKPNEGPALCIDEYRALDVCLEPEDE